MKIKLLDKYEAEIEEMFPQSAYPPWHPRGMINVWLKFDEAVGSCLSFAVSIEPRDYTRELFLDTVRVLAEATLTEIISKDIKAKEEDQKREESRKALNKITANLGDKLGISYILNMR